MNSLRNQLIAVATLLVLLLVAAFLLIVRQVDAYGRAENEREILDTTRALSFVVDGQLHSYESLLLALRASPAVTNRDWKSVDAQARAALPGADAWIVIGDRNGHLTVNTRVAPGQPLPQGRTPNVWGALDRGQTWICNLSYGPLEPRYLCVDAPIMENGKAAYFLALVFRPRALDRLVSHGVLGHGRLGAIVDRNGKIVWRNTGLDRFLGSSATPDVLKAISQRSEGITRSRNLEGVLSLAAFSRSAYSGWTFVVGVPEADIAAPRNRALGFSLALAAAFLAVAALLAYGFGRRMTRAIAHLGGAAQRIRANQPPHYEPGGIREIDEVGHALDAAVRDRDASQESLRLAQEIGGIGAWEWDLIRDEGVVSEGYREMHGLPSDGGPLRMAQVLAIIHPQDLPGYQERLAAAKTRPEASTNEYRVVRPDGSIRWIYAKGRPMLNAEGRVVRALGVVIDLTERREAEERLQLLMREVDHRANNLMAVVQGAVSLSRADDPESLREIILGRVDALARAHQLLAASRWSGADLRQLAEEELRPFSLGDRGRIQLEGDSTPLSPAAAQGVAMALHELATNAAKHGALSADRGRVTIRWRTEGGRLRLVWTETGGPAVATPERRGFGTTVLARALGGAIGGQTRIEWRPEGLVCTLELPLQVPAEPA